MNSSKDEMELDLDGDSSLVSSGVIFVAPDKIDSTVFVCPVD